MSSTNKVDIMLLGESRDDFLTKSERDTTIVFAPSLDILVGIRPEEVTKEASVGDISGSHDALDLLKRAQFWGETTVHAEDFLINKGCDGEAVEAVSESLPQLDVIAALAFIIESINTVDRCALMVATKQEEVLWVLNFVGQEQTHGLEGLLATINVISQEKVVGIGRETAIFEKSKQIVVLSVDITYLMFSSDPGSYRKS
jgi:hypothetical protein